MAVVNRAVRLAQEDPMIVAELIGALGRFPPDVQVVVPHFESGSDDVVHVHTPPIKPGAAHVGSDAHEGQISFRIHRSSRTETAVVLDIEGDVHGGL